MSTKHFPSFRIASCSSGRIYIIEKAFCKPNEYIFRWDLLISDKELEKKERKRVQQLLDKLIRILIVTSRNLLSRIEETKRPEPKRVT